MIQIFKKVSGLFVLTLSAFMLFATVALIPVYAATPADSACKGANIASGSTDTSCSTTSGNAVNSLVGTIINIFSWVVGVVAVIAIIYGGFTYVIANGEAANITKGRTIILYAIVGLVIVAVAQLIVRFVLGTVSKAV